MRDDEGARQRLQRAVGEAYVIGSLIGRGGFAEVFEASDPRLDRRVAIKALRADLLVSRELVERFQREARAMAGLRHPHVMEVYTVGERDGVAYFVMPLIDGESLGRRLEREGALAVDEARRILAEAAEALEAAHRSGTIHRDVKPDNILLEGSDRRVVITDFGLAKALASDTIELTGTGTFVGTPRYMSPEQAVGEDVDHRSDIYSLGVVAFQMVAGRPPFEAKSPQALVAQHLTEEPPPLWTLRAECPERLALIVQRCLAKDPGERWQDLAEMMRVLEGEEVADPAPSSGHAKVAFPKAGVEREDAGPEPAGASEPDPTDRFRAGVVGILVGVSLVAVADVVLGLGGVSAWLTVAAAAYLVAKAQRLWVAGYEWGAILLPRAGIDRKVVAPEDISGVHGEGLGRFGTLVYGCTSDRAAIMKAFADLPRQEQARVPELRDVTEGLANRIRHLARKVVTLEDRIGDAARRLEQEREQSLDAGHTPSLLSRHEGRLQELNAARDEAATELRVCVTHLEALRDALTEWLDRDPASGLDGLQRVLADATVYLSQRAS